MYGDQLARMRRMLRDPQGRIWTDAQLRNMYNQEQQFIFTQIAGVADVRALRIPPVFYSSYNYDWEWGYSDYSSGDVLQCGYFDDAEACCYTALWEAQELDGIASDVQMGGDMWVHPWEAWMVTPAENPPIPAPSGFHRSLGIFYDKEPIDGSTLKEVQDDPSWRNRGGEPIAYYRQSGLEDYIVLHPLPAVSDWNDEFDIYLLTELDEIISDETYAGIEV